MRIGRSAAPGAQTRVVVLTADGGFEESVRATFGAGTHHCLGAQLARMELQVVYSTLYRRIPTLRPATSLDKIPFKDDALVYGVYELPVKW